MKYLLLILGLVSGFSVALIMNKEIDFKLSARSYELGCLVSGGSPKYCKELSELYYSVLILEDLKGK